MKLKSLFIGMCLGFAVLTSFADDIGAFPGYVASPGASGSGTVVKDQYGGCVHNQYYRPDYATDGCDGYVAEPDPEPVPTMITFNESTQELFAFNSSVLSENGKQLLLGLLNNLPESSSINSMEIVGYTDALGSDEYNQKLSENRAHAVKDFISSIGVKDDIINARGMGEKDAVVSKECVTRLGSDKNSKIAAVETKLKKSTVKKDKQRLKAELSTLKKEQADLEACMAPDRKVEINVNVTSQK
ncbi:MAG: OmpA family protein [Burkholderiales bacterium]|nr:OmpA family protein [Burkholderiales bacterium]